MKSQPFTQTPPNRFSGKYLLVLFISLFPFLSCIDWDDLGGGGSPIVDNCKEEPSLFNGNYQVTDICDATWGSSDYTVNVVFANSADQCEWAVQNIFGKGIAVTATYDGSKSVLKIFNQNYIPYWQISGDLTRQDDLINMNLVLTSNILDSTILCTLNGERK